MYVRPRLYSPHHAGLGGEGQLSATGIFLGQGVGLIGGSFMTGRGRWAVTGVVMIAVGICVLAAARYRDRGSRR